MAESALQQKWDRLVSTEYGTLDQDIERMATVNGANNTDMLAEIGWALSRAQFEALLKGKPKVSSVSSEELS